MKKEVSFNIFDDLSLLELRTFKKGFSSIGKEMFKYCDNACSCNSCAISNLCVLYSELSRDLDKKIDEKCEEDE